MFEGLVDVEKRFDSIGQQLSDPSVISRNIEFQKLSKEYADLRELVDTYREYRAISESMAQSQEMAHNEADEELRNMAKEELELLGAQQLELQKKIEILLLPKDPNDDKNVMLEIRAGTGGDEAALFAAALLRLYLRFAETKRWRTEVMSMSDTGLGGIKEVVLLIEGLGAYSQLKYEGGVHRVQRVPATEANGRVHTSAVTVAVLPEADEVEIKINDKDLRIDVMRSGGPGGQSVNTTDSAVRITHIPSGLVVLCQDEKSQHKNKAKGMRVLRSRLLELEQGKVDDAMSSQRKAMVGSGDRSERIRTYNFPQNRLTDHRIGLTLHQLDLIMEGDLQQVVTALTSFFQAELLKTATGHSPTS